MRQVIDVLHCDVMEFKVAKATVSSLNGGWSLDEAIRAMCSDLGFELIDYHVCSRLVVGEFIHVRLAGKKWADAQQR